MQNIIPASAEAGGSQVQCKAELQSKLKASLDNLVRSLVKNKNK